MDVIKDIYSERAVPGVIALVGGDVHSMHYMATSRVNAVLMRLAPGIHNNPHLRQRMMGSWMDGFIVGSLLTAEQGGWPADEVEEVEEEVG